MPRVIISIMTLGFIALVSGLISLYQIISIEKLEAIKSLELQKQTLNLFAFTHLEQELKLRIRDARQKIEPSLKDPLISGPDLLYVDQGKQIIPREQPFSSTQSFNSRKAYHWLYNKQFDVIPSEDDLPWLQRISLFRTLVIAISNGNKDQILSEFDAILKHRSRYIISAQKDIPYTLALLTYISKKGQPYTKLFSKKYPHFFRGLLRDGVEDSDGNLIMTGLQRMLLEKRGEFTHTNFTFLSSRIIDLSQKYQVPFANFQKSALMTSPSLPNVESIRESSFVDFARWYIEPETAERLIGIKVNLNKLVSEVEKKMKTTGLLRGEDSISQENIAHGITPLRSIRLSVQSNSWESSLQKVYQRYYLKSGWIVACGIFAFAMIMLASLHQYRKHKYLSLKSDFLSAVSHELRTPLTSIRLIAETLESRLRNNPDAKDYPTRIVRDIDGLSLLVENILSYNRLQKGQWAIHKSLVDIQAIVDSINSELHLHTNKQVSILLENIDHLKIIADSDLIKLLLFNLIRNSSHYNEHKHVEVKIIGDPSLPTHLLVSDNGSGIDKSLWRKVFYDFYRIQKSTGQNVRGSGLGLSMCKRIMGLHQGKIRIIKSASTGTTFEIIF